MSPADIKHFLVIYDIPARRAEIREFGTDYDTAQQAYAQVEREASTVSWTHRRFWIVNAVASTPIRPASVITVASGELLPGRMSQRTPLRSTGGVRRLSRRCSSRSRREREKRAEAWRCGPSGQGRPRYLALNSQFRWH